MNFMDWFVLAPFVAIFAFLVYQVVTISVEERRERRARDASATDRERRAEEASHLTPEDIEWLTGHGWEPPTSKPAKVKLDEPTQPARCARPERPSEAYFDPPADVEYEWRSREDAAWLAQVLPLYTRPAVADDYDQWLGGYLANEGTIDRCASRPMRTDRWFVAKASFEIRPLYGAQYINIIVPEGVTVTGDPGHNELYFMDGFTTYLPVKVVKYSDNLVFPKIGTEKAS